ncbi:MAG: hypothetical protein ACR2J8_06865, partial [Thermomicrobiales bacterium]
MDNLDRKAREIDADNDGVGSGPEPDTEISAAAIPDGPAPPDVGPDQPGLPMAEQQRSSVTGQGGALPGPVALLNRPSKRRDALKGIAAAAAGVVAFAGGSIAVAAANAKGSGQDDT